MLIGVLICYMAYASVTDLEYCLVLEDDFKTLDTSIWNHEIQRGGFGTGSFEWTTDNPKNSYVDEDGLHIIPTLTTESTNITPAEINNNFVLNLTTAGTCTAVSGNPNDCSIRSNITSGAIINPVQSARLNTLGKKTITYGRVEVVAKLPKGDWLWPAIWMMPEPQNPNGDGAYGPWPASGEIDIMESRGNPGADYPNGRDSVTSALYWGPLPAVDAFWKTNGKHNIRRSDYSDKFHTYGLEWNENYLFSYVDTRLVQVLFTKFSDYSSMWDHGNFGQTIVNKSALNDPWSQTGRKNTPFDQPFYLILNVAVGGTNGFFPDAVANKPWGDDSITAPREFWSAQDQWYPTWGAGDEKGLTVKQVRMWKQGVCGAK
jgi:beta-glucanase (GH16 family)